ncbi:MAG: PQQ-binding-like beta-propeller repeat protein [Deltaproteobacteria bacterium]
MKRPSSLLSLVLILLAGHLAFAQVPSKPGDWPQWRGPNRDGVSLETGLLKEWPKEGPKVVWQVDSVGVGYSSLAVKDGRIFTQGDLDGVEHIIALSAADGKTLWAVQPGPVVSLLADRLASEFKQLDRNKDGQIDELEALQRFGWDFNRFDKSAGGDADARAKDRARALFARLDADGDGKLSFAEAGNIFRDYFERIDAEDKTADAAKLAATRAAALIQQLDKDGNGKVSNKEAPNTPLGRHFGRIDQRDPETNKGDDLLTAAEIEEFFTKLEPGRDGVLTKDELVDFYMKNKPQGDGKLTLDELRVAFGGYRNGMGDGPRGTPTVDGDRVFAEGGNGDVTCLDAATGKTIWYVNLARDFGGGIPDWGYSESPLVVDDLLIVTPGGKKGTLAALDKHTGNVAWSSGEVTERAHYSSAVLATIGGEKQIVQFARESVFGVSLQDGKFLWKYNKPANGTANCCAPIVDRDHVFASSSYGVGGGLAKITVLDDKFSAEEVYFEKKMACHHGGIVKIGDWMYSNGAGPLMCMDFLTGNIAWQNRSVGKGSLLAADGMLYVLSENHEMALVDASPGDYSEKGRFKIASHGRPSWAHPVVAGGRLYIRDQQSLTAYDIRGE